MIFKIKIITKADNLTYYISNDIDAPEVKLSPDPEEAMIFSDPNKIEDFETYYGVSNVIVSMVAVIDLYDEIEKLVSL